MLKVKNLGISIAFLVCCTYWTCGKQLPLPGYITFFLAESRETPKVYWDGILSVGALLLFYSNNFSKREDRKI